MQKLQERVLQVIRKHDLIGPGDRLAVAVSGGADSVALLTLLLGLRSELGVVLSVAHVNHRLRGAESDEDAEFVAELARRSGLELHLRTAQPVGPGRSGIEAEARELRYDFFRELAHGGKANKIATAHTLDDQAETVLLRTMRGTGLRGLAGIYPRVILAPGAAVVRPFLTIRRDDLKTYLREQGHAWREDSSNRDPAFLRNRVRMHVLPVLQETFGPRSVENLAELAEIARAEQEHWRTDHSAVAGAEGPLAVASLSRLSLAAQRQLIRNWLESNAPAVHRPFRLIEDLIELAFGEMGRKVEVAAGLMVRLTKRELRLESSANAVGEYEYSLPVPGSIEVTEIKTRIEAVVLQGGAECEPHASGLDPARLPAHLTIRNWRAGDRFWPPNTKAEKKLKELLSDRHMTGVAKKMWPVAVAEGVGVVWVRGFGTPGNLRARPGERALRIREVPLAGVTESG